MMTLYKLLFTLAFFLYISGIKGDDVGDDNNALDLDDLNEDDGDNGVSMVNVDDTASFDNTEQPDGLEFDIDDTSSFDDTESGDDDSYDFDDTDSGDDSVDDTESGDHDDSNDSNDDDDSNGDDNDSDNGDDDDDDDDDNSNDEDDQDDDDNDSNGDDDDDDDDDDDSFGDDDDDDDNDLDTDSDDEEDECSGLTQTECGDLREENGENICGYNVLTENCYEAVRRAGIHGSGNFDDGYIAAQDAAKHESQQLNAVIAVLGTIIALLVLGIIGGAYYFYSKTKSISDDTVHRAVEMIDDTEHDIEADSTR